MGKNWKQWQTVFLGSKITTEGDCSCEIKRRLLLGRKAITKLDVALKSRDITLLTKVCLGKYMIFLVVIYGCESWTMKKTECWRIDAFELWCWRRLLRIPWIARRSNHSVLKEINTTYSLEGLMLKLKLHYFATWCKEPTHCKRTWCLKRLWAGGEGEDRGWDGWMASPIQWTWIDMNWSKLWEMVKPGVLQSMDTTEQLNNKKEEMRIKFGRHTT